jgi:glycosyltransferase involved in cell wall biosynthesis
VEIEHFKPSTDIAPYFVAGGRLVPYKRLDMVVHVFNRLKLPLKIFGIGPEYDHLTQHAGPTIEFLGKISDHEKAELLRHAQAFIHPQLEDAGVTPLEAMSSGRPVIAYAAGGAAETVIPGETGILFPEQSWESLLHAVIHFTPHTWDSTRIREHAEQFNTHRFKETMRQFVHDRYEEFEKKLKQPTLFTFDSNKALMAEPSIIS